VPGGATSWYASTDDDLTVVIFLFKSFAFLVGMTLLPVMSRLTGNWDPPRELKKISNF
jgi:hypothetical protein